MELVKEESDCTELKTIKYKSMMMTGGVVRESPMTNNIDNLDAFLEKEKNSNKGEPWSKLDKTAKIKKLSFFVEAYMEEQHIPQQEADLMLSFLKDCLDRKRLSRVKDVIYDKTTGIVKDIPALHFNKSANHFTLKNTDKQRTSTLKSLPPKKVKPVLVIEPCLDMK
jgi:hypothetical protein